MCPPEHFAVEYAINPWMNPTMPVDADRAMSQWQRLHAVFAGLGHTVHFIDPEPGLPDMVFAANGGTVIGGKVLGARFRYPQRAAEGSAYLDWFRRSGYPDRHGSRAASTRARGTSCSPRRRSSRATGSAATLGWPAELEELFGLPVISVRLVDPRFYHLDTALCVLGGGAAAYYPPRSTRRARRRWPPTSPSSSRPRTPTPRCLA